MKKKMEILYKEMQERLKYLEAQEQTEEIKWRVAEITLAIVRVQQSLLANVSGSLPLQTKLEMFYDFLYERGIANQIGVGIDTVVKHFIDERLSSNDR